MSIEDFERKLAELKRGIPLGRDGIRLTSLDAMPLLVKRSILASWAKAYDVPREYLDAVIGREVGPEPAREQQTQYRPKEKARDLEPER